MSDPEETQAMQYAAELATEIREREKMYFFLLLHAFEATFGCYPDEREREQLHRGAWRCLRLYK